MRVIDWNPLVNKKLLLDGDYGYAEDYVTTIDFNSGKKRTYLKNSFVPKVYPTLRLALDNKTQINSGINNDTEFSQFKRWFEEDLSYGVLPFYFPLIGKPDEIGVYKFIPDSLFYDRTDGIILFHFGLEEIIGRPIYISTEHDGFIITETNINLIAGTQWLI